VEIRGIGPGTQERLYAAGIKTFAQLAQADPEQVKELAGAAVTRRYAVEDWIEEARQRHVG
jgi:predicted flap endonuclease-1-like 5' DNA nuclease